MVTNPTYIRKDAQITKGSFTAAFGVFLLLAEWVEKNIQNRCMVYGKYVTSRAPTKICSNFDLLP